MGMMTEFKEFAMRGSVVDLAGGVVIGGAFGKIVSSLVDNIIMPVVGMMTGGVDYSKWAVVLREATVDAAGAQVPALTLGIGTFTNAIIQFIINAFAIFLAIKAINRINRKPEEAPAAPAEDILLLREIRDSLRNK